MREIVKNLFRRKVRTGLTIFGIAIGIFALVVMGAMAEKIKLLVEGGTKYYGDKVVVSEKSGMFGFSTTPLSTDRTAEIEAVPGVKVASGIISMTLNETMDSVSFGPPASINAAEFRGRELESFKLGVSKGRDLKEDDRGKIVVGADLVKKLNAEMMAAITAGRRNKSVILIEKNEILGRKILATGNGRCNLTNRFISPEHYHSNDLSIVANVLKQFTQQDTIHFFKSEGVLLKEEDKGRIFPRTNQASTIVEALKNALLEANVTIKTSASVLGIQKKDVWEIQLEKGGRIYSNALLLATGGKAAHQFGSSGDGIYWAQKFGHEIEPTFPALVPIETREEWVKDISGVRLEAKALAVVQNKKVAESEGDVLFTHYGLSGPAIMALSRSISPIYQNNMVTVSLDLFPDKSEKELDNALEEIFRKVSKKTTKNALLGLLPSSLIPIVTNMSQVGEDKKVAQLSKIERLRIVETMKALKIEVKKLRPFKEAQVTMGGVSFQKVEGANLESKITSGLYFAGEILDVDADSGGFNLQWAWSSGHLVGSFV